MSIRAMIAVQFSPNGPFTLYYRHCDGYPTGLGLELAEGLKSHKTIDELIDLVDAKQTDRLVQEPQEAFPKNQGDLEWIYAIRMGLNQGSTSLSIYRTSNPYTRREFVFHVWHSYVEYLPGSGLKRQMEDLERTAYTVLSALAAFEKAGETTGKTEEETAAVSPPPIQICNECGRSVAPGSGWFVNRIPDFNEPADRKAMGKPFPRGDYICAECDQKWEVEKGTENK